MDPFVVEHREAPDALMARMMMGGGRRNRSNGGVIIGGIATVLGGGCVLAGGIVEATLCPSTTVDAGAAYDQATINLILQAQARASFTGGILYAIGGGLTAVGGGALTVGGFAR